VLKAVAPVAGMNLELIACDKAFALSPDNPAELLNRFLLSSPAPLEGMGEAKSARYVLRPANDANVEIPDTDSQTIEADANGLIVVTIRPIVAPAGAALPYKGDDIEALAALKSGTYVQSGDEKIISLSKQAVGDASDAAVALERIQSFVHKYVRTKDLSVGYATAAEVAASRQGDCTEHAVLAAALCRAAGIPAKVVVGLVYIPRYRDKDNVFGPHAWVRARIGDKWVDIDPTGGRFDVGHIALSSGSGEPTDFSKLLTSLGQFTIVEAKLDK
jgi:hypothetical protein